MPLTLLVCIQAQTYAQKSMMKEAAEAFEDVAKIAPENPDAQYHAGMGHLQVKLPAREHDLRLSYGWGDEI